MAQLKAALNSAKGTRIGAIGILDRLSLDLAQTLERSLTLLKFVEVLGEMTDRVDQHQQRRHIAAEALGIDRLTADAHGTDQEHRQDSCRFDEADNGMLQGQQLEAAVAGAAMQIDLGVKAILQPGFGGVSPHQGQARNRLGQQRRQLTDLLLAAFRRRHHPGAEGADQHGHKGRQQQRGQGQLPVEPDHVAEHHQQLQQTWRGVVHQLVDHLADAIGVFREPIGEIAGRESLQRGEAQRLQAGKQLAA
ncbi:MAG: hypothetical protein RLZZ624_828 [Cyanobacteriota bacterium]